MRKKVISLVMITIICLVFVTPVMALEYTFIKRGVFSSEASAWAREDIIRAIELELVPQALQSNYTQATTRAEFTALAVALYENVQGEITGRVTFTDTNDVNVQKMAYLGVVTGVGNNRFEPNAALTREQAAVMLTRLAEALGQPFSRATPAFSDNASISPWAIDGVGQAQASGIMGGVGDSRFAPLDPYTREQSIITMLRLFDMMGGDITESELVLTSNAEMLEQRVFELVNIERANYGLQPLVWHDGLGDIARAHSEDMVNRSFFAHNCPSGISPFDRMRSAGISFRAAAENVARGQRTPEDVMNSWMNSEGHRRNILNPDLTHLGVGFYNYNWTQKFIG